MGAVFHDGLPLEEIDALIASAIREAEDAAHEFDAEWCERGAQIAWSMLKAEGNDPHMQMIVRVCQSFAETIRTFKSQKGNAMSEAPTPEERAKALLEHLFDDFDGWPDWWEEDIAAAIEAAQRDALSNPATPTHKEN